MAGQAACQADRGPGGPLYSCTQLFTPSFRSIDIAGHRPLTLEELHDTSFDLIVTLSPEAHHQALELTRTMAVEVEYWPTFDATAMVGHASREQVLEFLYRKQVHVDAQAA